MPRLTRFTYGAIYPLNVEEFTLAELAAYVREMEKHEQEGGESWPGRS